MVTYYLYNNTIILIFRLFSGVLPRTLWITLGGYIFFGSYDFSKNLCTNYLIDLDSWYSIVKNYYIETKLNDSTKNINLDKDKDIMFDILMNCQID